MIFSQDPRFTFDTFVVGPGNRMAAAAARRAAESPRTAYNPLLIYGAPGSGKTHLLQAVGALALAVRPDLRVLYMTADGLVDRVSAAVGSGSMDALRDELLEAELVLLDEVHALAGKSRTQEELLALWDELEWTAQIVLAAASPSAELTGIEPELRARFTRGLAVDLPAASDDGRGVAAGDRAQGGRAARHHPGRRRGGGDRPAAAGERGRRRGRRGARGRGPGGARAARWTAARWRAWPPRTGGRCTRRTSSAPF